MYDIVYSKSSLKQLKKLENELQRRIIFALERIRIRPEHYVKKLIGEQYFRLRVGDYRIILDIKNEIITVMVIAHRKNVYNF